MFEKLLQRNKQVSAVGLTIGAVGQYNYYTFSTVGQSDLPHDTEGWCGTPNNVCFSSVDTSKTYYHIEGEIRSLYPSQHGVSVCLWNDSSQEWITIGSIQIPGGSSGWHTFSFDVPNLSSISYLLIYTTLDISIDVANGKLYYDENEGLAVITSIDKPSEFTPGVEFFIRAWVKNTGDVTDILFMNIYNTDTNELLCTLQLPVGKGITIPFACLITLTQTTDFHGRVDAGHLG